ncbi:enoyl-CoA hydratase/isomerase family protein [Rhizomonospora bruguierae]|uniref:enoyl-CoA hydratase/isomerase family protein n=1 Tax=Rhizomonospora bruguierae TaxID=1581705 RepID=UPI001BCD81C5|nr:enoyl-CoA hydratase/isomerase family protein [Micromonospora sp. NBRC 107566]
MTTLDQRNSAESMVRVQRNADHWLITLNRPRQLNAINLEMTDGLHGACAAIERDPRPVLILGEAGNFAAGADIPELARRDAVDAFRAANATVFRRILQLKSPTIALVDGYAFGGGAELAYACDFRIGTTRCTFANPEARLGIIAGAGACQRLPEIVGEGYAKEMLFTGRVVDAQEAWRIGLVTRLVEPAELLTAGQELVAQLNESDRYALAATKAVLGTYQGPGGDAEALAQAFLFGAEQRGARMRKFLDERDTDEQR